VLSTDGQPTQQRVVSAGTAIFHLASMRCRVLQARRSNTLRSKEASINVIKF
jgi:hypothetical protein